MYVSTTALRSSSAVIGHQSVEMGEKVCLVCLQANLEYCSLHSTIGNGTILSIISEIISLIDFVDVDDNFPQDICVNCLNKLIELVDFKHQVQDSIKLFQSQVQFVTVSRLSESGYSTCSTSPDELLSEDILAVNELFHSDVVRPSSEYSNEQHKERRSYKETEKTADDTTISSQHEVTFGEFIENLKKCTLQEPIPLKVRSDWRILRQCKICKNDFRNVKLLREHLRKSHATRPDIALICPICGKSFQSANGLKFHQRTIHSNMRPYVCKHADCTRRFAILKDLRAHTATHSKTTQAICELCSRQFTSKILFRRHFYNVHQIGRRPFKCAKCYKAFQHRDTLESHAVSHLPGTALKRVHRCGKCEKAYRWKSDLTKHAKTHSGIRPYPCKLCVKAYLCSSNLKRHLKEIHLITY